MVDYQIISTVLTGIGIIIALTYYGLQIRNQNRTRQAQLFMQLYNRYQDNFKRARVILEHTWEMKKDTKVGIKSKQAHDFILQTGNPELMMSRASVIISLNDMVEEGILTYEEESGKGGYHRVYYPKMNRKQFAKYVTKTITDKLHEVFQYARASSLSIILMKSQDGY